MSDMIPDFLVPLKDLKKKLRNLEPGKPLLYFTGNLGRARYFRRDVDEVARWAMAISKLGFGVLYQQRNEDGAMQYFLKLTDKLGMRKDGNGFLQEVERVASYV